MTARFFETAVLTTLTNDKLNSNRKEARSKKKLKYICLFLKLNS